MQAIERLQTHAGHLSKEELEQDVLRYYGIMKNIEIIGEAARMLTNEFKQSHSDTNWRQISGMRNFLIHEYFQVNSDVVWEVIHQDIVELKRNVQAYLKDMPD